MSPFRFEPLEQRTLYSADVLGFPAWSPTLPGSICYEEWPGVTSQPATELPRTGPLTVDGKLATFRGLKGVDPAKLTATIHWGDLRGANAGAMAVNDDGSVDVFGAYTYAESPEYDISIQLSGGYELLEVLDGPRWMDWNLGDPGPTAVYRHLYQFAWLPAGLDSEWVERGALDPVNGIPPETEPVASPAAALNSSSTPPAHALDRLGVLQSEASEPDLLA